MRHFLMYRSGPLCFATILNISRWASLIRDCSEHIALRAIYFGGRWVPAALTYIHCICMRSDVAASSLAHAFGIAARLGLCLTYRSGPHCFATILNLSLWTPLFCYYSEHIALRAIYFDGRWAPAALTYIHYICVCVRTLLRPLPTPLA